MENKSAWAGISDEKRGKVNGLCEAYKGFISACKTERECTAESIRLAEAAGYRDLEGYIREGKKLAAGDKVYAVNKGKALAMFTIGQKPMAEGMHILGAHIDSPRLDLKQNPLVEENEIVLLKTHYYGGIKKYQWVTLPLALHGVIAKKDGSTVNVVIGEDPEDPVLVITDLLPHLGADQMGKTAAKVIEGEKLNVLFGSTPAAAEKEDAAGEEKADAADGKEKKADKEACKKLVLSLLKEKYGVEEEDFVSAELEVVPAGPARDLGLDRGMILGYGHDDRVCAYTSLMAMLEVEAPVYTSCCLLVDKEEIGSVGATGMHSRFFENTVAELIGLTAESYSDLLLRRCLKNSRMLSSDVSAGFDPNYPEVNEKNNACFMGHGFTFNKYTGSRGKSGCNDAGAEFIAYLREVMDGEKVKYQTSELGRVDQGGGGTIAYILAAYDMDVIDCGVPVLSMHAPWEAVSKVDVYETYAGYKAFLGAGK